jgi:hypothetical protein
VFLRTGYEAGFRFVESHDRIEIAGVEMFREQPGQSSGFNALPVIISFTPSETLVDWHLSQRRAALPVAYFCLVRRLAHAY